MIYRLLIISRNSWKHSDDGNFQTSDGHIESFDKVQYDACSEALANVWGNRNKVAASCCKEIDTSTDDDSQYVENGRQYLCKFPCNMFLTSS